MNTNLNPKEVLAVFSQNDVKEVTIPALCELLGIRKAGKSELRNILRTFLLKGKIVKDRRGRFSLFRKGMKNFKNSKADRDIIQGKVIRTRGRLFLQPMDNLRKNTGKVYIPIRNLNGAREGQVVNASIITKGRRKPAYADVTATIREAASFQSISREFFKANGIPLKGSAKLTQEQEDGLKGIISRAAGRVDLRKDYVLAIDPKGAKDHDDAVSLMKKKKGGWILHVHIADVAEYVTPDLSINKEAVEKSFTTYLPWTAVHMLPPVISSDLCSLIVNKDRLALTCKMDLADDGTVEKYDFFESIINVKCFMTYTEAWEAMQEGNKFLELLSEFAGTVLKQRQKSGVLNFEFPDAKVILNEAGEPCAMEPALRLESHSWIEECMLLANKCTARFLLAHKLPGIHRVHEPPDSSDVMELANLEHSLFHSTGFLDTIKDKSGKKNIAENNLRMLYKRLLDNQGGNDGILPAYIQRKILKTMKKAQYSPDSIGHFALGFGEYAHFTSPIRRYPDLWNHRLIKSVLNRKKIPKYLKKEAYIIAEHASAREYEIMKLERKAMKSAMAWILRDHVGRLFDGTVSGFSESGMWVLVENDLVYGEGWISLSWIKDDFYEYREKEERIVGRRTRQFFALGDRLRIQLEKTNPVNGFVDFSLVSRISP